VRLRVWHPFVAVVTTLYLVWALLRPLRTRRAATGYQEPLPAHRRWLRFGLALAVGELVLGAVNIALAAPGWMQLVHLLAAHLLWMAALLSGAGDAAAAEAADPVEATATARAVPLVPEGSAPPSRPA